LEDNASDGSGEAVGLGVPAYIVHGELNADLLGGNSASGNGSQVVQLSGTIGVSSTLPAEPAAWEVGTWGPVPDNQETVDALTVPAGKTLTVAPGAVVKGNVGSACDKDMLLCSIIVEGALDAVGTVSEPIVFTSLNDNSVGGTTGTGSPKPGDWFGIGSSGSEGSVDLEHVNLSYAYTGLDFAGTDALLTEVSVSDTRQALDVQSGSVSFRGSLENVPEGISACNWGIPSCSADAAYTYWGSSAGPFPAGKPPLACGTVTTSPYLTSKSGGQTAGGSDLDSGNCDGSTTLGEQFASAQQSYTEGIHGLEIECGDGYEEACKLLRTTEECLTAAYTLGEESSPFTFSNSTQDVASVGANWLASSESRVVSDIGQTASFALGIVGAAQTIIDIANAYSQCG
jgi:hypothetical protein